jgi:two-component SAPR family response regulator
MKIVIIEDEEFAARRLENMIRSADVDCEIVARLESVSESVEWFMNNPTPDLIFLDIHLEDNVSFAIFDKVSIACPVVFTTATDELSTRAFKLKNIDYLLKPIIQSELDIMLDKYKQLPQSKRLILDAGFFSDIFNRKT